MKIKRNAQWDRREIWFSRLDGWGVCLAICCIVMGQLIWLPDRMRLAGTYWISVIDQAIVIAAIPFGLWIAASVIHLGSLRIEGKQSRSARQRVVRIAVITLRIIAISGSISLFVLALTGADNLILLSIGAACVMLAILLVQPLARKVWGSSIIAFFLLVILLFPTPYMVTYPGLTVPMNEYARAETGQPQGEIIGVLVFERPAFPIDRLYARLFPAYSFVKRTKDDPPLSEQLQAVRSMKLDANAIGSAVAFQKSGVGQGHQRIGVRVIGVTDNGPAVDALQPGDIVIGLNEERVTTVDELLRALDPLSAGEDVRIRVLRGAQESIVKVTTGAHPETPGKPVLGVHIQDEIELDLPLHVDYTSFKLHEGGPSHGAMLTLTLIDQLTPGGVTNGNIVAGTGTISLDGNIGRIGGIRQKAYIVERKGADVFFVPEGQEVEARKGTAGNLNIVPVKHIDDILAWLESHPKS